MTTKCSKGAAWLVELEMFPHYQHQLCEEIRRQGYALQTLDPLKPGYSWQEIDNP